LARLPGNRLKFEASGQMGDVFVYPEEWIIDQDACGYNLDYRYSKIGP